MSSASHKQNINPSNNETNFTPIKKVTSWHKQKVSDSQGVKTLKALNTVSRIKCSHCGKYGSLIEFKVGSPERSAILLPCVLSKELATCVHINAGVCIEWQYYWHGRQKNPNIQQLKNKYINIHTSPGQMTQVKSFGFSSRAPRFNSQHTYGS